MDVPKMTCKKRGDKWWIAGVPGMDPEGCGPYDNKADAEDDLRGLERFYKHGDEPGYLTIESRKKMKAA